MFRALIVLAATLALSTMASAQQIKFQPQTTLVFAEGIANAPTQELAYLVVASPEAESQQVALEVLVDGRMVEWSGEVPSKVSGGRFVVAIRDLLASLQITSRTFSLNAYCERRCAAQIVVRDADADHFWLKQVIIDPQIVPNVPTPPLP